MVKRWLRQHIVFQWLIRRRVATPLMAAVTHFRNSLTLGKVPVPRVVCFTFGPVDSPAKLHIYGAASHGFTVTLVGLASGCYTFLKGNPRLLIGYSQLTQDI